MIFAGTSAMCYRDSGGPEGNDPMLRGDEHPYVLFYQPILSVSPSSFASSLIAHQFSYPRIDPAQEIARLRHSINQLEAYVFPTRSYQPQRRPSEATLVPKQEPIDPEITEKTSAPGMLDRQAQGGLYTGPTSAALHLLPVRFSLRSTLKLDAY